MTTAGEFNALGAGYLPGFFGIEILEMGAGQVTSQLELRPTLMAPNGYLHAASIVALADTTCGYGTIANLPAGAQNFTTIELKTNFLGTARDGSIRCAATLVHGGRTTQVWDARVLNAATGQVIALFRCTQYLLY